MKYLLILIVSLIPTLFSSQCILAQQAAIRDTIINDTLVYRIDPVMAFGRVSAKEVQQRAFVLSPKEISNPSNESAADLARDIPSGFVQTNSRGESLVYLRGSGERQTAVLFDGAVINIPWDNRVDLSFVPISMVEYMTVVPGTMSILYGPNTLGGAVSLAGPEFVSSTWSGSVATTISDGGVKQFATAVTHRSGDWNISGFAESYSRAGLLQPQGEGRITNSQATRLMAMTRALFQGETNSFSLTAMRVQGDKGVTPEMHLGDEARFWKYSNIERTLFIGNYSQEFSRQTSVRLTVWGDVYQQDVEAFQSAAFDTIGAIEVGEDLTVGARVLFEHDISSESRLDVASTWYATNHTANERTPSLHGIDIEYASLLGSSVVELTQQFTEDIKGFAGIGLDLQSPSKTGLFATHASVSAFQGTIGVSLQLNPSDAVLFAVGKRNRFPTAREQYSGALGKFTPNIELGPESGLTSELTFTHSTPDVMFVGTAFYTSYIDGISRMSLSDGTFTRVNVNSSAIGGISLYGDVDIVENISLDGHATWMTQSTDDAEVQYIEYRPELLGLVALEYDDRSVRVKVSGEFTGEQFGQSPDSDEFLEIAPSFLLHADLGYTLILSETVLAIQVSIQNVLDTESLYQLGLVRPGRTASLGVTFTY